MLASCPPLSEWLVPRAQAQGERVGVLGSRIPPRLRKLLRELPELPSDVPLGSLDALVSVETSSLLGKGEPPPVDLLRPGGLLVELCPVSPTVVSSLLGLEREGPRFTVAQAQRFVRERHKLGLWRLELWRSERPARTLVAMGHRRP